MVFFSLDQSSFSSPSPTSRNRSIASWISELDDSPDLTEPNSLLPLTPSKLPQRKSKTIPIPLQSNLNLCSHSAPLFSHGKQILGRRKFAVMDKQEQSVDQGSPRRSGRTKSPTRKVLDNVAANTMNCIKSVNAQQPILAATSYIPLRTKSPVKSIESPRKPKQDLRSGPVDESRGRTMDDDDESENNMFPKLQPITFDPSRETTIRTRSTSPHKERAEMKFYDPSIVFLSTRSSDHPQDVTAFMMKFRSTMIGKAVIPEYLRVCSMTFKTF